ncbi:MAG: sugar transferase [Rikenellaceae bacterium]|nr:sugar transferase [Rikenellaceae bacterium]
MLPIESEKIRKNESVNDGLHIHLYFDESSSVWMACGSSAYLLRLFVKRMKFDCLRGFSETLQMPCTLINGDTVKLVMEYLQVETHEPKSYICLVETQTFDKDDYARWVEKLCQVKAIDREKVATPVSHLVPKDTYIADGMSSWERNIKRMFDCLFAFIAIVVFSPLYLICYVLIKREDGGPAIYKQERIGRFGRPFYIYKFRSMRLDAEKMGPQLSHSGGDSDPRLTKVGAFIRAHHLDELPQLYNVFVGDMSFVGPRPERKFYIDQIVEYDKRYVYLYQIRPGVTSPATLYNGYTDTMEKMLSRLEWDLYYLGHRSWWLDISILFKTFCRIVFGKIF